MRNHVSRIPAFVLVLAGMVCLSSYYAVLTHVWWAAPARRLFAVRFIDVPGLPGEAVAIWVHNSKLVAGVTVCVAVIMLVRWAAPDRRYSRFAPLLVADAILLTWTVGLVLTVGVLIGAYGAVQARAFWPYAPVEVCGWALMLAVYVNARTGRANWWRTVLGLASVEVLLALAALLEVFGSKL